MRLDSVFELSLKVVELPQKKKPKSEPKDLKIEKIELKPPPKEPLQDIKCQNKDWKLF
jgi:hypothetical protein